MQENYKTSAPTVAYKHDFVFDKDLYVQGEVYVGNTYEMVEPEQFTDRKSNGFYVAQIPKNYLEKVDGKINMIESQLCAVHEGGYSESCDGHDQNVYLVVYSVGDNIDYTGEPVRTDIARPEGLQYIGTSKNFINFPQEAYGNDFIVQFEFSPFNYRFTAKEEEKIEDNWYHGFLRIGIFNESLVGHPPTHTIQDVYDIHPGRAGSEPIRFRRAIYSKKSDGTADVDLMEKFGVRFWSTVRGGSRESLPFTPSQSTGSDPVVGMPLFRFYYKIDSPSSVYGVTQKFTSLISSLSWLTTHQTTVESLIKWWEETHPNE